MVIEMHRDRFASHEALPQPVSAFIVTKGWLALLSSSRCARTHRFAVSLELQQKRNAGTNALVHAEPWQ
jgi:hypothetical protein